MTKEAADKVYLNYDDYSKIKKKSDSTRNYVYTDVNADLILNYANVDTSLRSKFGTAYKELFRHLHDSGLMYSFMDHTCKYASYLLHKEITTTHEYDLETYKNFYYYAQKYYEHEKSTTKLCLNNMYYIDSDMFTKINALYGLYDSYTKFLNKNIIWNDSTCDSIKALVREYSNYLMNHESTSKYLNGVLEHFRDKLNDTIGKHKTKCPRYGFNLEPIKLFIEHKEEQPITEVPITQPQEKSLRDTSNNNGENQLKGPTVTHIAKEVRRIEATGETKPAVDSEQTVVIEHDTGTQTPLSASNNHETLREHAPYEPFRHLKLTHRVEPSEQPALIGESTFIPQNGLETNQGFMANMRNAITGVLGEVDPVPVVGVSGGMGALFLLFRVFQILNLHTLCTIHLKKN
ncbi:hypothetical protein PVBG_06334 [Plasmodium vivax Brazil I]|uniref:Uncharacterized protein n=1 Tax=Plasmodium vivax (strain Brazil I) TaxID=1033975 RepID=A0A0J9VNU3_PLAV1|nr:hypothetical protein PVBG_06334 [Plasmodium vivax Brazil I]